jgi:hypothetical protein
MRKQLHLSLILIVLVPSIGTSGNDPAPTKPLMMMTSSS